jgi:hypothetical protein
MNESFLVLFFKKEQKRFFLKKEAKTSMRFVPSTAVGQKTAWSPRSGASAPARTER